MFTLSSDSKFRTLRSIEKNPKKVNKFDISEEPSNWHQIDHLPMPRLALVLKCFNKIVLCKRRIEKGEFLIIKYGAALDSISDDGLHIRVTFVSSIFNRSQEVFVDHIITNGEDYDWQLAEVDISKLVGKKGHFEIYCGPGPDNIPLADWLAISEFHVCQYEQLTLSRARMHNEMRIKNETAHFAQAYKMPMFNKQKVNAYTHASGIIKRKSVVNPINFRERMLAKAAEKKLKVLSLCSGIANKEAELIKDIEGRINLTLFDINNDLLKMAAEKFDGLDEINFICGNANNIELKKQTYDIIICVSALHHVVELEKLIGSISESLTPQGEFWSIGEYIGYEGARLWPDSFEIANNIFKTLPERFRINHTRHGEAKLDNNIPNNDCSINTFEGIRSSEVFPILEEKLTVVQTELYSTIAWRVLDPAYVPNYDMDQEEDVKIVEKIANLDVEYFLTKKLQPVGMNAIFSVV